MKVMFEVELSEQEAAMLDLLRDRHGAGTDQQIVDEGFQRMADESNIDWHFAEKIATLRRKDIDEPGELPPPNSVEALCIYLNSRLAALADELGKLEVAVGRRFDGTQTFELLAPLHGELTHVRDGLDGLIDALTD